MIQPGQHADAARPALHDRLAEYSRAPDANFTALRDAYERGPGLRVPDMVYNAVRDHIAGAGGTPASTHQMGAAIESALARAT
ncbi:MAG: hypothetical protein HYX50_04220 [Chloroflexi bacterium]|nr:hypothetical protein [Chloroflexota bacterium]